MHGLTLIAATIDSPAQRESPSQAEPAATTRAPAHAANSLSKADDVERGMNSVSFSRCDIAQSASVITALWDSKFADIPHAPRVAFA